MEEQALYRAILSAPHDDTARLVYADWLDENTDQFPDVLARSERARAEFIRVQCKLARLGPGGWKTDGPSDPELAARQKRLILQSGRKWRRAFPVSLASSPFDRGFPRPLRSMRPHEFLGYAATPDFPVHGRLPTLAADSPARRYVSDEDIFAAFPLWDVHLYATPFAWDPLADRGQYGDLLADVGRSPSLERVGWLKVSFFHTPVFEFLRTGNFANVETLVLNCGPFPEVLEAVAENESFRSLRYVRLGDDWRAWGLGVTPTMQFFTLASKLREAAERHVPHGEMRAVLRAILRDLPPPTPPAPPVAIPRPLTLPTWAPTPAPAESPVGGAAALVGVVIGLACACAGLIGTSEQPRSAPTPYKLQFDPDRYKIQLPPLEPYQPKKRPTFEELLQSYKDQKVPLSPGWEKFLQEMRPRPVAPPPRPVPEKPEKKE